MAPLLAVLGLGLALLLAAAKTHGRQVRLERELEGHHHVVFGGDNPPLVVALWRRDRIVYWTTTLLGALAGAALVLLPDPGLDARLLAPLLGGPIAGFVVAGLASHARLLRRMRDKPGEPGWRRAALRGSALWWSLVGALLAALSALSVM